MASTADDDARADLLKSLGVARRRGQGADGAPEAGAPGDDDAPGSDGAAPADPAAEGAAPDPAAPGPVASGLGIRRRKPVTEAARPAADLEESSSDAAAGPAAAGGATGLGFKCRKPPEAGAAAAAAASQAADAGGEPAAATGPRRRLGNDQAALILANYFRGRPRLELPDRVWDLERTHGFYTGDGRPERKLFLGFEPGLVLYVIPVYPEGIWPTVVKQKDEYTSIDPGLHRQPRFLTDGFVVDAPYNELGEGYVYVAFRSDGQPLELADTTAHVAPEPRRGAGPGLRRRK